MMTSSFRLLRLDEEVTVEDVSSTAVLVSPNPSRRRSALHVSLIEMSDILSRVKDLLPIDIFKYLSS
jgi:hypothetical protein